MHGSGREIAGVPASLGFKEDGCGIGVRMSPSHHAKGEHGIWQRRFQEHLIRNDDDFEHHVNDIHYNPVKHRYVKTPSEWQSPSIHRFIKDSSLKKDWAIADNVDGHFGE